LERGIKGVRLGGNEGEWLILTVDYRIYCIDFKLKEEKEVGYAKR